MKIKRILTTFILVTVNIFASDFGAEPGKKVEIIPVNTTNIVSGRSEALKKTQTTFTYNENSVYEIVVSPTYVTVLQLSPDEEVQDYIIGDIDNWPVTETKGGRKGTTYVVVSAEEENLQTNLIIVTNKRLYNLKMTSTLNEYNSVVKWNYPDTREMILFSEQSNKTMATSPDKINLQYYIGNKNENFSPENVYDDGEFTYFKMKKNFKNMPVIFMQDVGGNFVDVPIDVNNITEGNNILKVRKVSKKIRFVIGKKSVNIINQNYK